LSLTSMRSEFITNTKTHKLWQKLLTMLCLAQLKFRTIIMLTVSKQSTALHQRFWKSIPMSRNQWSKSKLFLKYLSCTLQS